MFSKIFVRSYPVQQFLIIATLLIAYLLIFVFKQADLHLDLSYSIFSFLELKLENFPLFIFLIGFIALLAISYFMTSILSREKIVPQNSYMMVIVFMVLSLTYFSSNTIHAEFLAFLFIAPAYAILLSFSKTVPPYIRYADIGILIGLASLLYPPTVLFLVLFFIVLILNNLLDWRAWIIPLFLILIVQALAVTVSILFTDFNLGEYGLFVFEQFQIRAFNFESISNVVWLYSLILTILFIVALLFLLKGLGKKLILIRKVFLFSFWAVLLLLVFGYFYLGDFRTVITYWGLPASMLFTNYFTFRKKHILLKEILFLGLIAVSLFYFIV